MTKPKHILVMAASFAAAVSFFGVGYIVAKRGDVVIPTPSEKTTSECDIEHRKQTDIKALRREKPLPPPPLALPEMRKAVVLEEDNPDAFRERYLNRVYRVVGTISSVIGTTQSEPDTSMWYEPGKEVFRIKLQDWDLPSSSILNIPDLAFSNLPASARLAMRPGQEIDANCTLTGHMTFAYCHLNEQENKAF